MRTIAAFLFSGLLCLLCSCQPTTSQSDDVVPGVTDSTILIGSWGPLTGPAAAWGVVPQGMDAFFQQINEAGGIHGRKIEFVYQDDAYDPSRTVGVVRELVLRKQAFALLGGVGTATGMAVKDFIVEQKIPWVSPCSGATYWAYPPETNIFSFFPLYLDEAEIQVSFVLDSLKKTRIGLLYQNDDFGKSALLSANATLAKRGLTLAAEVPIDVQDADLSSHLARLQAADCEVVLLWVGPRQAAIVVNRSAVAGFRPQWLGCTALSDMDLMMDLTDGAWQGAIFGYYGQLPESGHPQMEKYRQALARYQPDVRWGTFSSGGFLYAEPMAEALRRAGRNLTRQTFIKAMESLQDYQGTGPKLTYAPNQRQGHRSLYLARCQSATQAEILTDFIEATSEVGW